MSDIDSKIRYPLTTPQEEVWFDQIINPHVLTYTISGYLRINGPLDTSLFERSIDLLIKENDALRTLFHNDNPLPTQEFPDHTPFTLQINDLSHDKDGDHKAIEWMTEESKIPVVPGKDSLYRFVLIKVSDKSYYLYYKLHHLISDGFSENLIFHRVSEIYNDLLTGAPYNKRNIYSYKDFISANRTYVESEDFKEHEQYCLDKFKTIPDPTFPVFRREKDRNRSTSSAVSTLNCNRQIFEDIKSCARELDVSVSSLFIGILYIYFVRVYGKEELVPGLASMNRNSETFKKTTGMFSSVSPVRFSFGSDLSFSELLRSIDDSLRRDKPYMGYPVSHLNRKLKAVHNDLTQLYDLSFSYEPFRFDISFGNREARFFSLSSGFNLASLHIALCDHHRTDGVSIHFHYDRDVFHGDEITLLQNRIFYLLKEIPRRRDDNIREIDLIPERERKLLAAFSTPVMPVMTEIKDSLPGQCVHEIFKSRAKDIPDKPALIYMGRETSYRELDDRSDQLAHYLTAKGAGPESAIGLCMERSPEMITAILAILKAGAVYFPLDPDYPEDRLSFMVEDAGTHLIVTHKDLHLKLDALSESVVILNIDNELPQITYSLKTINSSLAIACLMYTSGSTGQPKGVEVTHQGIIRLARNTNYGEFSPDDTFLMVAPVSFDASTLEIWSALLNGGTLAIHPHGMPSIGDLGIFIEENKITNILLTTALFHLLVSEKAGKLKNVRQLIVGGDVLSPIHVREILSHNNELRLINAYGPTENTTITTCHSIKAPGQIQGTVPIGKPINNTTVRILDSRLNEVPIGVPGELCTGGQGLARGYLNRPDLTAERFVPDPYSDKPGSRLYRTGDLARFLPDGVIEFLGRMDRQVKVRGYRIEPGEIESHILKSPAIKDTTVIAHKSKGGDKTLTAYLVPAPRYGMPEEGVDIEIESIKRSLKNHLPEFMVPHSYMIIDSLPLTGTGKIDHNALPLPDMISRDDYTAPRNSQEESLAGIWRDVLGTERIGIYDNFFSLGGHSLSGTQVISRIGEVFDLHISLKELFDNPTIDALAEIIQKYDSHMDIGEIRPVERIGDLPLSFAQERLWFLDQLVPDSAFYNIPMAYEISGPLDANALDKSFKELLSRHETLRTAFIVKHGKPVQVINRELTIEMPVIDLHRMAEDERIREIKKRLNEEAENVFDLKRAPLLRVTLLKIAKEKHILLMTIHHIISDGWSMGVINKDISLLYNAFTKGEKSPLPDMTIQYADFSIWQRNRLTGKIWEVQLDYWKNHLKDLPLLELPLDKPRPPVVTYRGSEETLDIPKELTERLKDLSNHIGGSLFMTLLSGFMILMSRYAGINDIVVGSPVAHRVRKEIEPMIGFFVNTLIMRGDLSGNPTFYELVNRIKQTTLDAYSNQDIPFEHIVEALRPERDMSRTPLVQIMFNLQNEPMEGMSLQGLNLTPLENMKVMVRFDMEFHLHEVDKALQCRIIYNRDLFDRNTVSTMAGYYKNLLENICENPGKALSEYALMSKTEQERVVVEWNRTDTPYPAMTIPDVFEKQADQTPDRIALVYKGETLTYGELNKKSDQLAGYLRNHGVRPEVLTGLCMERSMEVVIAILAIVKAGGAYVPLDPNDPSERLSFIAENSRLHLIITHKDLHLKFNSISQSVTILNLDIGEPHTAQSPSTLNSSPPTYTSSLLTAYIMHTSGSTGQPKGVAVPHKGVVRLVKESNYAQFGPDETFLLFAPLSFDASTFEIWGALLNGGKLVIHPPGVPSLEELGRFIRENHITTLWLTAGLFHQMVKEQSRNLRSLRQLFAGGDVLSPDVVKDFLTNSETTKVINGYGPTENTTFTCCYSMDSPEQAGKTVSIGRPISNTTVYILDSAFHVTPPGIPGELYAGGDGPARGYLNRPDLTAERFIPDPFGGKPGSRLYRTGDLARYLPDGNIEFLGRIDRQVKIRGYRIEPGEIEAQILHSPMVKDITLIVREDKEGDKRLTAYLVMDRQYETPEKEIRSKQTDRFIEELKTSLKKRLPDYMVPVAWVIMDKLPLTATGKIDCNSLPKPEIFRRETEAYAEPRTPVEKTLVELWSTILGIKKIGIYDNFFNLGGHSLLATRVISGVGDSFGADIPLRELFENPTIAGLSERIANQTSRTGWEEIKPVERAKELPLSFAQERLWFLSQLVPDSAFYNIPWAFEITGPLDRPVLEKSFQEVVRRHEILRTAFVSRGGEAVQITDPDVAIDMPVIDLCDLPEKERDKEAKRLMSEEGAKIFDLGSAPLLRVTLLKLSEDRHILLMTMHHIVSDGWSTGVMNNEISVLYRAFSAGEASPLPDLPVQYSDFTLWQRKRLKGDLLERQLDYWRNRLGDIPLLELPPDRARPATATYRGAAEPLTLSEEVTERLKERGLQAGGSLFMTLLAGFMVLMSRYTGQEDIVIGAPIANRTRKEIEPLIGFFVNTLVMRGDLRGNPSFTELLKRVKEITLEAYSNQDIPFEYIVDELRPERDTSRNPLVQVMFALQNAPMDSISLQGLELNAVSGMEIMVRFDMECHFFEVHNALQGMIVYNTDLFDRERIRRMAEHYKNLLEGICENPERALWEYALMIEPEKERIVSEWNETETPCPDKCIHEIFETRAEEQPDKRAILYGDGSVTYRELNERANHLARHLIGLGVKSETVVAVSMERSPELIIALLGILKAGGVYFPIDPSYPVSRRKEMIRDAAPVVIIKERSDDGFESGSGNEEFLPEFIYRDSETFHGKSRENPPSVVVTDNRAYINYTSGSTGTPKGIEIPHKGVLRLLFNTGYIDLSQNERIIHASNISFDAATFEIWGALLHGGTLVILPKEEVLDPRAYRDVLESRAVTTLFLTTALFNRMTDEIPDIFKGVKNVLFGGEAADAGRVKAVRENTPPKRLLHVYGPTESTTFATWHEVARGGDEIVPIGRPINNTTVYIVDRRLNPVPVGIPGELCIGGDGTARGYLNKPDLTAEKFIPDPFGKKPGSRLYRTGDLVRYLSNGSIEFLGRTDRQVKVRGYRIEPGEIEARIVNVPMVKDTTVILREDRPGDKRLTAYLTLDPRYRIPEEEIETLSSDQVSNWEEIFNDHVYTGEREIEDPLFNTTGWNSSYDGSPIAVEEMREWADDIITQVLDLKPKRVLELGCGTGMLLLQLAPRCESYEGWDISEVSLDYIKRQTAGHEERYASVKLAKRMAHELDEVEENTLDAVILSSVVQYFPDMDYLVKVIEGSARAIKPGGFVLLADLRNYRLMRAFHTSTETYKAAPGESVKTLKSRIDGKMVSETELFVDPSLFIALKERIEKIGHVRIRLQRGSVRNEMTTFRYTAILHVGEPEDIQKIACYIDGEGMSLREIGEIVKANQQECICIRDVINSRVMEDVASDRIVHRCDAPETVMELNKRVTALKAGIDPDEIYRTAKANASVADISWSDKGPEYMDVIFAGKNPAEEYICIPSAITLKFTDDGPLTLFGNNPVMSKLIPRFLENLKISLKEVLPDYMIPVSFVVMDALPLTATGKIDRNSLPKPETFNRDEATYAGPRTQKEETLADIWKSVLSMEEIGIYDNFFHLGGHSLLATQVISRIRETFQADLPLRKLFENPTVAGLAEKIEKEAQKTEIEEIKIVERGGDRPLSFAQERLWFLDRLVPDSAFYNMPWATEITGPLNMIALEKSFHEIVRRHETLRTAIVSKGGTPVQIIYPDLTIDMPVIDLCDFRKEERKKRAKKLLSEEAKKLFNLEKAPLLRVTVLKLSEDKHILLMTMHHIISDGWSTGVINKEISALYREFSRGDASPLPDLTIQYADFAQWQRNWLTGAVLEDQLTYWKEHLKDLPLLELPTNRPRPAVVTYNGDVETLAIPHYLTDRLRQLGNRTGGSLFMTLLAGFMVLMARYTGQEDIVVGTPIANRTRKEIEPLIGFFINTLVMRGDLSGNPTFMELLKTVKKITLEAYGNQDIPFEHIVEALKPERDMSRNPLVQVIFALQNAPMESLSLEGLDTKSIKTMEITVRADMECHLWEVQKGIEGVIYYNTDLFDRDFVKTMAGHYKNLLHEVCKAPETTLWRVDFLDRIERDRIVVEWNRTEAPCPTAGICEVFENQAKRTPDKMALVYEDTMITYGELNNKSDQLARYLGKHGVGPEVLTGLCMERSIEMVTAILSIVKAGGAYVPLDPNYPKERLSFIREDSQLNLIITHKEWRKKIDDPSGSVQIVNIDTDWPDIIQSVSAGDSPPSIHNLPLSTACVLYTSGSTGLPKGVRVTHRGVLRLVKETNYAKFAPEDTGFLFAPLSFDASTLELWSALLNGGKLVIFPSELPSFDQLGRSIKNNGITNLLFTTALFHQMVKEQARNLKEVRQLIVGGDVISPDHVREILETADHLKVINAYGPTENTTITTCYPLESPEEAGKSIPIGRPIDNTTVYILDRALNIVPIGVPGELCTGGDGLAQGYHNRPDLTAERFIPDPFGKKPGARLYRTGDKARYLPDGNIEFMGRLDFQVKIRGFRIEPGEIEAALSSHQAVEESVVTVKKEDGDEKKLLAYVLLRQGYRNSSIISDIREYLREKLPEHMIPSAILPVDRMPLTPVGKIDHKALPEPDSAGDKRAAAPPGNETEKRVAAIWRELLKVENPGLHENFFDLGGHSLLLVKVHAKLEETFNREIPLMELFRRPDIHTLSKYINHEDLDEETLLRNGIENRIKRQKESDRANDIAVISMALRLPDANTPEEFWRNLCNGKESIRFFSDEELEASGIEPEIYNDPNYIKAGAVLEDIENFDASFFGFTPREAESLDPQHRLFLECCHEAVERAGYVPDSYKGRIGVYGGASMSFYLLKNLYGNPEFLKSIDPFQVLINNDKDHLATRVSYKLNLKGPALNVNTACSTSLVAISEACQGLIHHRCDMALAGGASVKTPQISGYRYNSGGVLSPDGHCRAFDAKAGGTVGGSGVGVVFLKRMEDALADGDRILAVIKGSSVNNDGSVKPGYSAPGIDGQIEVIAEAHAASGTDPSTITCIEAHGTGTEMGDPIEIEALTKAFRMRTGDKGFCAIGSVKTNLGHLDSAAGVTGFIKALLALKEGQIPPTLHFEKANPKIDFENSPFYVNTELREWKTEGFPRRAGVSSFGIGGTNAHIILEQPPHISSYAETSADESGAWRLLILSAKTDSALNKMSDNLVSCFKKDPSISLSDTAYTLQIGRQSFHYRRMVVCRDVDNAIESLEAKDPTKVFTYVTNPGNRSVIFMFPGLGDHYVNMSLGLYRSIPSFRKEIDRCSEIVKTISGMDIREVMYNEKAENPIWDNKTGFDLLKMLNRANEEPNEETMRLNRTRHAHPAVFIVEYAMAMLWIKWGIEPTAMTGYSLGEYAAACISGVISLEDALRLVVKRAEIIDKLPGGVMVAAPLSEKELKTMISRYDISIATVNTPDLTVLGGSEEEIIKVEAEFRKREIISRRLATTHAFHSKMMEGGREEFLRLLKTIEFSPPKIPYISNLTGTWIKDEEATDPAYWADHTCRTVRFSDGIKELMESDDAVFLEVGPGQGLGSFTMQHSAYKDQPVLGSIRSQNDNQEDMPFLLTTLGKLWLTGVEPEWSFLYAGEKRYRIPLPAYPFEKKRYWIEPNLSADAGMTVETEKSIQRKSIYEWFYIPAWKRESLGNTFPPDASKWLIFADDHGYGEELCNRLTCKESQIVTVMRGDRFAGEQKNRYKIRPGCKEDYAKLISGLREADIFPHNIVHMWNVSPHSEIETDRLETLDDALESGFYSLLYLAQVIGEYGLKEPIQIGIITNNMQAVNSDDIFCPEKATLLGPCKVIPKEFKNIRCCSLDIEIRGQREGLPDRIVSEFTMNLPDPVVAYRGYRRWIPAFEQLPLKDNGSDGSVLRNEGVYLITGGLGGIGLGMGEYLAKKIKAKVVLIGRTEPPPRNRWDEIVDRYNEKNRGDNALDLDITRITKIRSIEAASSDLLIIKADVSNKSEMEAAIAQVLDRFGEIHGVIHGAGVPGAGLIELKTKEMAEDVFAAKVKGTLVLESVLKDIPLDFMILFSSLTSITGETGQVDYVGANAFLDAYSHYRTFHLKKRTRAVNWDAWQWDNWQRSLMNQMPEMYKKARDYRDAFGLNYNEGAEAMIRVLAGAEPQVMVSLTDFYEIFKGESFDFYETGLQEMSKETHGRPLLGTPYVEPDNDVEERLAEIWGELFGIDKIGVHDNFFQLGGHSLLGVQLIHRIQEAFEINIPLKALFEAPNIRDISMVIEEMILLEIEGLTEEEIRETIIRTDRGGTAALETVRAYELPNKMKIMHLNKAETDHFYKDIFEDLVYYRNGITLNRGDTVFDIGANIGLFSLFILNRFEDIKIYAFEPAPPLFEILKTNTSQYGDRANLFNFGLSKDKKEAEFTFYPRSTGMSTFFADIDEEEDVLRTIMENQQKAGMKEMDDILSYTDDLMAERFREEEFTCELKKLSDIIEEQNIDTIHLLKIDVQKSELDVLEGIHEDHWKKIKQIVIEVHDIEGRVDRIRRLLENKEYGVTVVQDELYKGTNIFNIYGLATVRK